MDIRMICYGSLGILLGIQSLWDIRYREIPNKVSILGILIGILFCVSTKRSIVEIGIAFIPAGLCYICSRLSKEAIGLGDVIILFVMSFYYSIEKLISICMLAFGIAGVIALLLFVVFHKKGNYQIPFVPFLWIGWMIENICCRGNK